MTRKEVNYYCREFPEDKANIITATLGLGVLRKYEFERLCTITGTPWRDAMEYLEINPSEFCLSMSDGIGNTLDSKAIARYILAHGRRFLDIVSKSLSINVASLFEPGRTTAPSTTPGVIFP